MKNKIIQIGFLGIYKCYLNVSEEEAIRRYNEDDDRPGETTLSDDINIDSFEFDDEFGAYEVWSKD